VFDEDWQGPKWVHKVSPVSLDRYLFVRNVCDECLVLVEDCFSAFCVGRHTSALCLLGTHASEHMLAWIQRRGYPRIRIFLDDDNADVKKSQTRLKAKLELFCDDVQIIHSSGRDPKEHSDAELKEILCGIHDPSI
jgi:transposase InsO family protein